MKTLLLWTPACVHMALLFAASSVPGDQLPGDLVWDKGAHLSTYALLGVLLLLPLARGRLFKASVVAAAGAVALALVYGVTDEIHQSFTPGRSPDVMDVLADTIGAALGVTGVLIVGWLMRTSRNARAGD